MTSTAQMEWKENPSHARVMKLAHREFVFCAACEEMLPMASKKSMKHGHFKGFNFQPFDRAQIARTAAIPLSEVFHSKKRIAARQGTKEEEEKEEVVLQLENFSEKQKTDTAEFVIKDKR